MKKLSIIIGLLGFFTLSCATTTANTDQRKVSAVKQSTANAISELCLLSIKMCKQHVQSKNPSFYYKNLKRVRIHCKYLTINADKQCAGKLDNTYEYMFNLCITSTIRRTQDMTESVKNIETYEERCNELVSDDLSEYDQHLKY